LSSYEKYRQPFRGHMHRPCNSHGV
jgi:hypothetical protein